MPHDDAKQMRWDLSNIYAGLEADDYRAAMADLERQLGDLAAFFDSSSIRRLPEPPQQDAQALASTVVEALQRMNSLLNLAGTIESFVYGCVTTNSYDAVASRELSKLELLDTRRRQLRVRLDGWIGSLGPRLGEVIDAHPSLAAHRFFMEHTAQESRYLMDEPLEALAAELCVDGGGAFGKLQGNVTSQLKAPMQRGDTTEVLPITVIRNLSYDPDPEVRRRAYEVEIAAWASIRTPVAAALNAVKGTAITLAKHRGRSSVLEAALVQNRIDQETLDALMGAIREAFPVFRRYLKSKAAKLGHGEQPLPWWDLFAPLGAADRRFSWSDARDFIAEKFGQFTPELGQFAATAFDQRWIDGEPRDGKRGGAYCMEVLGTEESRILANFDGSFDQVSTLAHELGHAYHNHCQRGLEPLRRGAPSTLAETASIFCETLVAEAALQDASPGEQLMILEAQLSGATQVCLDISSRFLFESRFIERRKSSELAPDEICELMLAAQAETYGDGVAADTYHPYMWLWKPHYYSHDHNFYNFPYAFGHLFGLGLYAIYQQEGDSFIERYRSLLRDTANDYARPLAQRFGIDIAQPDFWRSSLAVVAQQVERFAAL